MRATALFTSTVRRGVLLRGCGYPLRPLFTRKRLSADCWAGGRNASGFLYPELDHFPNGLQPIIDYVHQKGLSFGLYTCGGNFTCVGNRPGSRDHWQQDAAVFAAWGVDWVKMDWCFSQGMDVQTSYGAMSKALNSSGRHIAFSMCVIACIRGGGEFFRSSTPPPLLPFRCSLCSLPGASGVSRTLGSGATPSPRPGACTATTRATVRALPRAARLDTRERLIACATRFRPPPPHRTPAGDSTAEVVAASAAIPAANSGRPYGWNDM